APPGRQLHRAPGPGAEHHARPSPRRRAAAAGPSAPRGRLSVAAAADAGGLAPPGRDCPLCPRLVAFRAAHRLSFPDWHHAPVPAFGGTGGRLLVVGLAPGLRGANRTGRPFTGDYAGDLLYATLRKFGFARGDYGAAPDDGLALVDCRITNGVRCVPPENKP